MIWYTADLHLLHDRVAQLRGFNTTAEHDRAIVDNWERTVDITDTVYVLGDLTLKNPKRIVHTITSLPGTKHLIPGNHDPCHPLTGTNWRNKLPVYNDMFHTVTLFDRHKIAGQTVLLSHFPYTADHTDETRHLPYRLPNQGHWLLHGHTHSRKILDAGPAQIHIGQDAWEYTPVDQHTIRDIITTQP